MGNWISSLNFLGFFYLKNLKSLGTATWTIVFYSFSLLDRPLSPLLAMVMNAPDLAFPHNRKAGHTFDTNLSSYELVRVDYAF